MWRTGSAVTPRVATRSTGLAECTDSSESVPVPLSGGYSAENIPFDMMSTQDTNYPVY